MKLNRKATIITTACVSGLALAGATQMNQDRANQDDDQDNATQVGIVKSDLVLQNYQAGTQFQQRAQDLQQRFAEAQQQGDQQMMQQLQQQYAQMQTEAQQKFESDLKQAAEKVADDREIDFIVTEVLYQSDRVEEVDLTSDLIEEINSEGDQPRGWPQQDD